MSKANNQQKFRTALSLHQQGNLQKAASLYREIIEEDAHNSHALHYLGIVEASSGNFELAKSFMARSVSVQPPNIEFLNNFATILWQFGDYEAALQTCQRGLELNAANISLLYLSAISLYKLQRLQEAQGQFDKLLAIQPTHVIALNERASVLAEMKHYDDALASVENALTLQPQYGPALLNKANLYSLLERYQDALAEYDKVLTVNPDVAAAWLGRGNVLRELESHEDALSAYDKALALQPNLVGAWIGRGKTFMKLERHDDSLAAYDKALMQNQYSAGSWLGRGNVLSKLRRYDEAFDAYNKALAVEPDDVEVWLSVGNTLADLKRYGEALAAFDKVLGFKPDRVEAWFYRGKVFGELKRYDQAFAAYDKAFQLKPDLPWVEGERLHVKMHLCNWNYFQAECARLLSSIENRALTAPGVLLAISSSPEREFQCAELYSSKLFPASNQAPVRQGESYNHPRIRVAYLSADFREHPVANLLAGLIEHHNRECFEIIAISFAPDAASDMQTRLKHSFDQFINVHGRNDLDVATLLKSLEVDIAVDLMGYTGGARTRIFAYRPCGIQVNFLGYPGTMGADYIDYLIADRTLIPESHKAHYKEKIVYLPNSYQVNDSKRTTAPKVFTRAEAGLPDQGFVFCCFNNNYKITPDVFDCWMRIVKRVEGSVLWLYQSNAYAASNLRKEAEARGVSASRLIFAEPVNLSDHLARHRLADLFLDTRPYNAHTTGSDALWAGLPLLTQIGETFAGRVAASLLNAIGLPELVTSTSQQYEDLAIEFATNPQKLAATKLTLSQNRLTKPLFNTQLFTRHIEAAYTAMYERRRAGLPHDHIGVPQD